ncbi:DUF1700 domain-containing protein [Oceanobacillus sp. J11TS1]|uniref:DUF1700 domain-containing protein n=1 Tax=Oceanobacillus sp. J11TS1 TaxID=2807191 RepID=UPI001B2164DC|nr:DUF1700 domain-containing protein [Oceanobacillus sp. J11TS1]GIO25279.1 hypothetical protein J11TS1_38600 [Oceanobacillus sp. J11TS1]
MNKLRFLEELQHYLKKLSLSSEDREEIIQDFEEHFELGRAEGKTDEEIVRSLGSPQQIAKDLQATQESENTRINHSDKNIFRTVWTIIGLAFFNLVFVLGPSIAIAGIILAIWITAFSFVIQVFLAIVQWIIQPGSFYLFELFASLAIAGLGLLLFIGAYYTTKAAIRVSHKYIAFNVRTVKGGKHS